MGFHVPSYPQASEEAEAARDGGDPPAQGAFETRDAFEARIAPEACRNC